MKRSIAIVIVTLLLPVLSFAQVDGIRQASKNNSTRSSGSDNSSDSDNGFFYRVLFFLPEWQKYKLLEDNKTRYPSMVSFEAMIPGGYKAKDTYFLWPHVRANWGLFSTDFRMNYMFEKNDAGGGYKQLHTNDWQVLQLNITTSRVITFRVGAGMMTEAFNNFNRYTELTVGLGLHAPDQSNMFYIEYRDAFKSGLDVKARIELNAQYMHQIFKTGALKGYLTGGVVYQKYYSQIDFWAVQAGLAFRVFKDRERF